MDKAEQKKKKAKKARLVVIVVLLLLVPLAVVGTILALNLDDDLNHGSITAITMNFKEDSWDVTDKNDVLFFRDMVQGGSVIDAPATPLEEYRHLKMTFHKLRRDLSYELLLSDSVNDCLYLDPAGTLFLIAPERSQELLVHPRITALAMSFAAPPVCSLSARGEETPTGAYSGEWTYTKVDGTMTTESVAEKGERKAVLPADAHQGDPLVFTFSLEPDKCNVQVMDNENNLIYSGDPAEMERLSYEEDTELRVTVTADWFQSEEKSYRGKIIYEFDLLYDVPTLCVLSQTAAYPGDTLEIRVAHSSSETVAVTTTFPAGDVTQHREGRELIIRIPVAEDATPNVYSIVLLGADVDESFDVSILAPEA